MGLGLGLEEGCWEEVDANSEEGEDGEEGEGEDEVMGEGEEEGKAGKYSSGASAMCVAACAPFRGVMLCCVEPSQRAYFVNRQV